MCAVDSLLCDLDCLMCAEFARHLDVRLDGHLSFEEFLLLQDYLRQVINLAFSRNKRYYTAVS